MSGPQNCTWARYIGQAETVVGLGLGDSTKSFLGGNMESYLGGNTMLSPKTQLHAARDMQRHGAVFG